MSRLAAQSVILMFLLPVVVSAADLRTGTVVYEGGEAKYQVDGSQYLICDQCFPPKKLAPAVPPPPPKKLAPSPEMLSVEGDIPSPWSTTTKSPTTEKVASSAVIASEMTPHPLTTVYFVFNSARLRPEEKLRLRKAAAAGIDADVMLRVEGYTCRIGSKRYNKNLSRRRADAVATYLRALGVSVREVAGLGKLNPQGGPISKDRRAVIIIKERNYIP